MRSSVILLLLVVLLFSCEDPLDKQVEVPGDLISSAQDLFEGDVLEKGATSIDEVDVWKIKLQNSAGSITTFYWRKTYNNLFRIEGEKGPFDYEIKPPFDVVNFSTAKFLAFNQNTNENMASWTFLRSNDVNKWYYRFYLKDVENPITIDAGSGEIVR